MVRRMPRKLTMMVVAAGTALLSQTEIEGRLAIAVMQDRPVCAKCVLVVVGEDVRMHGTRVLEQLLKFWSKVML